MNQNSRGGRLAALCSFGLLVSMNFSDLKRDAVVAGFEAKAVYQTASGQPMGGRFVHQKSGFTLDLIQIQSVPQAFLCVKTFPTSNMGEPHTQEHLLLGKGNTGRAVAAKETMSMVQSTAFTSQLRTCYPFSASAGTDSFFEHFERGTHALLNPDYTDEEIRREVRNFGVKADPSGKLELEEKGTIYAEMVSSSSQAGYRTYRAMNRLLMGPEHPMSFDSGGDPKYIREMKPHHIRSFHAANYHLANVEMVASLPKSMAMDAALARFDAILNKLQDGKPARKGAREEDLPKPRPAAPGTIQIVEFPSRNPQQPGPLQLAWPVLPRFSQKEEALAGMFTNAVAGDAATNLYKLFVDSKTRKLDLGARSIGMNFDNEVYGEFSIYVPDLGTAHVSEDKLKVIRRMVKEELARVAAYPDDSMELRELHNRMQANLLRTRRSLDKLTSSPPGFGGRMGQSIWPSLLKELNEEPQFEKSLVQADLIAYLESVAASGKNIWREKVPAWKLTEVEPYMVAAKASPALIEKDEAEYKQRLAAEVARLKEQYQVADEQEAIRRYQKEYDAASAELQRVEQGDAPAKFLDKPPLTLDDELDYAAKTIAGGVPLVTGRFSGMSSANAGLALNVREWTGKQTIYAAILPQLLTGAGMTKDGKVLSFEDASQRMRREILGMTAAYTADPHTGRMELVISGSGNTLEESRTAVGWMKAALYSPQWTVNNAPRIRDVVDQTINGLRQTMQRSEESWVNGPASAWTYQRDTLYLSMTSFQTRLHHLHRLRWMLIDAANDGERDAVLGFFREIESVAPPVGKEQLETFANKLSGGAKAIALEAVKDLLFAAADLPAGSRAEDWKYLVRITRQDFETPADVAVNELDGARKQILKKGNARLYLTASAENAAALEPLLEELVSGLSDSAPVNASVPARRGVAERVMAREKLTKEPLFVGLLAPNMQGGVFLNSAKFVGIRDLTEEAGLNFLASKLYSGGGPHGVFMKTWGAGLAYSNGLRSNTGDGRIGYYAERTPELPQTLEFVISVAKNADRAKPLAEYALAQVFSTSRAAGSFESRTAEMAKDLADGYTPEVVRAFRESILKLRNKPKLDGELYKRMDAAYAKVLPGYAGPVKDVEDATYYVIGPEKQLAAWETYLKRTQGPETRLRRLYARDYWVVVE
jgi:Zn-dependent M16 (insulinase) family peptidase